jgi:hypothetical protein
MVEGKQPFTPYLTKNQKKNSRMARVLGSNIPLVLRVQLLICPHMKFFYCNVMGFGNLESRVSLKIYYLTHKPDLIFIVEQLFCLNKFPIGIGNHGHLIVDFIW